MSVRVAVNKNVNVTAVYFKNQQELDTYPRRMEYNGRTYTFSDGLQLRCEDGEKTNRLFNMTDGTDRFNLMSDDTHTKWTLLGITKLV